MKEKLLNSNHGTPGPVIWGEEKNMKIAVIGYNIIAALWLISVIAMFICTFISRVWNFVNKKPVNKKLVTTYLGRCLWIYITAIVWLVVSSSCAFVSKVWEHVNAYNYGYDIMVSYPRGSIVIERSEGDFLISRIKDKETLEKIKDTIDNDEPIYLR
jgi:predicted PurR-regulated permease PerM